jgi:hypothetical protein
MKSILAKILFLVFMAFVFVVQAYAETAIYDTKHNFKFRIDDNGQVFDGKQKCKARIVDNKVYDNTWNHLWFVIDGSVVYDGKEKPKFHIEGNRVYDAKGNLKYVTEGDSISQCKWNAKRYEGSWKAVDMR